MHFFSRTVQASFVAVCLTAMPMALSSQGLLSAGLGIGGGVGERNKAQPGSNEHALGYLQLHPPLLPLAVRVDALYSRTIPSGGSLAVTGDAVIIASIPFVQPYALIGYGHYGVRKPGAVSGWNGGVGIRVRLPPIAVFAEARRHQRIGHDLLTVGLSR